MTNWRDEAWRSRPRHCRYHGAAEEHYLPDGRQAVEPGAREAGEAGKKAGRGATAVLHAGRQVRPDPASALRPCQAVQARQAVFAQAQDLSRPRHPVIRDIARKIDGDPGLETAFAHLLSLAWRVRTQERGQRGPKIYSLHAPEVECIGKGKAHKPYEFGVKVSVATTLKHSKGGQFVAHVKALPGNPYDGHTLAEVIPGIEKLVGTTIDRLHADAGYRGHNAQADYKFKIYTSKQKHRVTTAIKREMRRRSAVEPVIGHLKDEHRMGRNYLAHRNGDLNNAILAAVGYNFRRLIKWLRILLRLILMALFSKSKLSPA